MTLTLERDPLYRSFHCYQCDLLLYASGIAICQRMGQAQSPVSLHQITLTKLPCPHQNAESMLKTKWPQINLKKKEATFNLNI